MKTKFKDVAHLYLGCDCFIDNNIRKLDTVAHAIGSYEVYCSFLGMGYECSDIKPILRPLTDISESELLELLKMVYESIYGSMAEPFKEVTLYSEGTDKIGCVCYCYMGQRIGFTIEIERGVEMSSDSNMLMVNQFDCTKWLLSKHIDLFSLIDNGEAIDKTKL